MTARCRLGLHRWLPRRAFGVYDTNIIGEVCSQCACRRLVGLHASSNPITAQEAMDWLHDVRGPGQVLALVKGPKP